MRRKWVLMGLTVAVVGGVLFYLRLPWRSKGVTQAEVQALTAQLASLFASRQHSLVSALEAAAQQTPNPYLRQVLLQIRSDVQQNVRLYRAMEKYPDVFSPALYLCRQTWHELLARGRCVQGDSPALVF